VPPEAEPDVHNDDPPQRRPRSPGTAPRAAVEVLVSSEVPRLALSRARVQRLARHVLRAERIGAAHLTISFVSAARIARLHRRFLGARGDTDIVTLEHDRGAPGAPVVGEIHICPEVARPNARAIGIPLREELARLVVHGVLHTLGWDHPEGADRTRSSMWRRQEVLLRAARRAGMMGS
jgi:probable rRNA maturation factor